MKILLLLLVSCFPALSDHLQVWDDASSAIPLNLHASFAQPSLHNIASSKSARWSQLRPRQLAAVDQELACLMRVRGGMSLRRGQVLVFLPVCVLVTVVLLKVINFMTGEPVEEVEFEDIGAVNSSVAPSLTFCRRFRGGHAGSSACGLAAERKLLAAGREEDAQRVSSDR